MSVAYDEFREIDRPRPVGLGHNSGRSLREMLAEQHGTILQRADDLRDAAGRVPEIDNDDTLGKAADFVKQITATVKKLDAIRVDEKEPFLTAGREVDGLFNGPKDALEKAKSGVSKKMTAYLEEKARKEREAREAEERARREEARRQEEARLKAEAERRAAEEAARKAEEETRRLANKRKQDEEATARAEQDARIARERLARAEEEAEAERKRSEEAEAKRIEAEKAARAKPADMARTRGDMGALATLRRKWVHEIVDPDALDLNQLRPWLSAEALAKAIDAAIRNGVRPDGDGNQPIPGVRIYEISESTVR
jgi:DNA repair exonuclease SbcCD ATPase subunit